MSSPSSSHRPRSVLVTIDYEVFGSGAGDVRQHVVDPTERMARIADELQVPLVIFFELEEYLAFERYADPLRRDLGYDPAALMRNQARDLVRRGHDLQLHLHPQWYRARYEDRTWHLELDKLTVDDLFEDEDEVIEYMADRTHALRRLIEDIAPNHPFCAYRAGGFAAQPGGKLLNALARIGYQFESSVVHGMHHEGRFVRLDYRGAPRGRRCWRISQDVAVEDRRGPLLELPVHSTMGRRIHQLTWSRLQAKFSRNIPKDRQMEMVGELGIRWNPIDLLRFLRKPVPIKLDFHNVSPRPLLRWIQEAPPPSPEDELDALILIGHSKEHVNDRAFRRFLRGLKDLPGVTVSTFAALSQQVRRPTPRTQPAPAPAHRA